MTQHHDYQQAPPPSSWAPPHSPPSLSLELDADRIAPHLYQGAFPQNPLLVRDNFDVLVLCACELQPRSHVPGLRILRCPLDDEPYCPLPKEDWGRVKETARLISECIVNEYRVLTTCAAGINRSGLVNATALCMLGMTGNEAISLVRRGRPGALRNHQFLVQLLCAYP